MAHFFLDKTFELWRDNQGTKEFRNYFDRIAETLNISKDQYKLTTEQQEKWARMTEAYLFGMGIPDGQKGIFDLFYKWKPSQYRSIQDLRYMGADGKYHNPILSSKDLELFNDLYKLGMTDLSQNTIYYCNFLKLLIECYMF